MNEAEVERTVTMHAKRLGWSSMKPVKGRARMYLRKGVMVYLVFGTPNASQHQRIIDFRAAGFSATWVDNFEDGKRFFANR